MKRIAFFCIAFAMLQLLAGDTAQKSFNINHDHEIVLGFSGSLTGSLGLYGSLIKDSIELYFRRINDSGGVHGKKLRLIALNDDGDPLRTEENINLLKKQGVRMFIGNMGTRSILKVLPQIQNKEISIFFPWSGDAQLRNPELTNIINGPGLMQPQLEALTDHIVNNIKLTKIAIFHADDAFSTHATHTLIEHLKKNNIHPATVTSYNRYTLKITEATKKLIAADPKIVICVGTSTPVARLINLFFEQGHYDIQFLGIDSTLFVGDILKYRGVNFSYSSAVPSPRTSTTPLAQHYLKDLKSYKLQESPNILSFSYYLSAAIVVEAIKKVRGTLNQQTIIQEIEKMQQYNLEGITITFDPSNRHAFGNTITIINE